MCLKSSHFLHLFVFRGDGSDEWISVDSSKVFLLGVSSLSSWAAACAGLLFHTHLSPFSRGLPLTVFHSHLLSVIIQHSELCGNCAVLNIVPLYGCPFTAGHLLLLRAAPLCLPQSGIPARTCQAWIILKRGQENTLSAGCLAVGEISQGLATGIKLSSPNREINGVNCI